MIEDIRLIPKIPFTGTHGLSQALLVLLQILVGLFLGGLTVPSQSSPAHVFRLGLLVWLCPKIIDYSTSRTYSFGNTLADQLILSCVGWNLLTRLLDLSLLPLVSTGPPRWIRPTKEEYARISELRQRSTFNSIKSIPDQRSPAHDELIPKRWEDVPFPAPFSLDRLLYAYDYLMLIRPTTSDLLPWQCRAFDWSLPALNAGGVAGRRFGRPETGPAAALVHLFIYVTFFIYVDNLAIRSIGQITMAELSAIHQLLLPVSAACLISLSAGPCETVIFRLLLSFRIVPPTALLASFNQPYLASSIREFWGKRWHHRVRRQLTRIGSLFPLGRTKTGNVVWAYVLSAMLHSFILARSKPEPRLSDPTSYFALFFDQPTVAFFLSQGLASIIEQHLVPSSLRRLWFWTTILIAGRWYVDGILKSYYKIAGSKVSVIKMILEDIDLIPTIPFTGTHGLLQALQIYLQISLGLFLGGLTVPSLSWPAHGFRLGLLVWLCPKIMDYSISPNYSFGNTLANQILFSYFGWTLLASLLDLALLPFVSPGPPRWIRPTEEELERVLDLKGAAVLTRLTPDRREQACEELIPKHWQTVPFPAPFSTGRLLYAYDYLTLVRPTTSPLFPWQFRAFDWSMPALSAGGVAGRGYGRPETGRKSALVHLLVYVMFIVYVDNLALRSIGRITMAELGTIHQLMLTIGAGCLISLATGPCESVIFRRLLSGKIVPPTALLANFNQPYLASSIQDFWGNRWHHSVRRQLTRLGSLFPLGRTKTGNAFWAYVLSAMLHSFILARSKPEPSSSNPASYLALFFDRPTVAFFVSQGFAMMIERHFVPHSMRRLWFWITILIAGRWYIDGILKSYITPAPIVLK
ncbi:hypothetical protein PSTT_06198, partial [Puccinia striiformis]